MINTVIFDFDGTLSSEREYIYGCFKYAEKEIEQKFGILNAYEKLKQLFNESWNDTFGRLLIREKVKYDEQDIKKLVKIYRQAPPVIKLYEDTEPTLQMLKHKEIKTAILTNGFYQIQNEKIKNSGLEEFFNAVEIPDLYGREFWKPDARRLNELLKTLGSVPEEVLYIGDSDSDYKMAQAAGTQIAFIKREDCVNVFHFEEEASYVMKSLLELETIIYNSNKVKIERR